MKYKFNINVLPCELFFLILFAVKGTPHIIYIHIHVYKPIKPFKENIVTLIHVKPIIFSSYEFKHAHYTTSKKFP